LLAELREVLRTEPNVRLAVLYGSAARGTEHTDSDLDVVVDLGARDRKTMSRLRRKLAAVTGRRVELVTLAGAEEAPGLLTEVLRDGRVLVDRDGSWPRLARRRRKIERQGELAAAELLEREREAVTRLERRASG